MKILLLITKSIEFLKEVLVEDNTFTDSRDGHKYKFVSLGNNQIWMAENLAWLPSVNSYFEGSKTEKRYYVYNYNSNDLAVARANANYAKWGVLYNWPAAMNGAEGTNSSPSGVQGACPAGWHLPGDAEWKKLETFLGMTPVQADFMEWRGSDEGKKLKNATGWNLGGGGTNLIGFSALPGGRRDYFGSTLGGGSLGFWWTTSVTQDGYANPYYRELSGSSGQVYRNFFGPDTGAAIRCVKD